MLLWGFKANNVQVGLKESFYKSVNLFLLRKSLDWVLREVHLSNYLGSYPMN